jgi:hypothetical protein
MALPAAIQAQVEQADALLAAMNAPPQESQPQGQEPGQVDLATLARTAPTSNTPQAEPPAPTVPLKPAPEETWEARYKALHGIFTREVPTLQSQVKALTSRLEQSDRERAEQTAKPVEQVAHKPEADPKDVENFGSDLVDMVQRTADRMFGAVSQKVDSEFAKLVARLTSLEKVLEGTSQSVAVTAEEKFFDKLTAKVANWDQINSDPLFIEWLQESDPVYGVPRQAALNSAREQLNADRAAAVFLAFQPVAEVATKATTRSVDRQVSPKTGASDSTPAPANVAFITQKQITDFYNDVARRKYAGNEAEAARIEQAINTAIAEGRVR